MAATVSSPLLSLDSSSEMRCLYSLTVVSLSAAKVEDALLTASFNSALSAAISFAEAELFCSNSNVRRDISSRSLTSRSCASRASVSAADNSTV